MKSNIHVDPDRSAFFASYPFVRVGVLTLFVPIYWGWASKGSSRR